MLSVPLLPQMAYECSSGQVKSFGFANRMMLEMLGCARGYKELKRTVELLADGGTAGGGASAGGASSSSTSGPASVKSFAALRSYGARDTTHPVLQLGGFLRTHFMTMLFISVFFASFVRRRRCC